MTSPDPLVAIADRLYALRPEEFTAARDAAAKDTDDKGLAAGIRKLRRPALGAWAVNLLVRREGDQVEQALRIGASLRDAAHAMDADQLRELTRQRRQLTAALATTARSLAHDAGVRLAGATVDQVEGVLTAGMLDATAAEVVRTGQLVKPFTSTGVDAIDPGELLAVPQALGWHAEPGAAPPPPALRVAPESVALKRERAEQALQDAEARLAEAEEDHRRAEEELARWNARRLQVHGELDEARRRIAELESDADRVDVELEDAEVVRADADEALSEARAARDEARRRLDRL
ncbi:MAG: hypothetical protein ACTHJH_08025 [Marmoricola sp.]